MTRPASTAILILLQTMYMHRNVRFAESSRAPALWRQDQDVNHQIMVLLPESVKGHFLCLREKIRYQNAM